MCSIGLLLVSCGIIVALIKKTQRLQLKDFIQVLYFASLILVLEDILFVN